MKELHLLNEKCDLHQTSYCLLWTIILKLRENILHSYKWLQDYGLLILNLNALRLEAKYSMCIFSIF